MAFNRGYSEISSGIIHLLRETGPQPSVPPGGLGEEVSVYRYATGDGGSILGATYNFGEASVVLIPTIPSELSPSMLLQFIGIEFCQAARFIRLIRDPASSRCMCIVKFQEVAMARSFTKLRGGQPFASSIASDVCVILPICRVELTTRAPVLEPLFDEAEFAKVAPLEPSRSFIELPSCPFCLDRLDGTASGIPISMCRQRLYGRRTSRGDEHGCPICRAVIMGGVTRGQSCVDCKSPEDLWLCLICGHAGCGRYRAGHASEHFLNTGHNFTLELLTNRIWDYMADWYEP